MKSHVIRWVALTLILGSGSTIAGATAPVKSPQDDRQYESLVLANELRVLLISDPDTDKAAAALDVNVGTGSDPRDREGLAHFLEHMLFLGTEKYPTPGEYGEFVSAHGGQHNAYTGFEHTNYFFDIDKERLKPALDRFAQFFTAPLFTADYVKRERKAVDAEYQSHRTNDDWRVLDAVRQAVNPRHPYSRFSVGTLSTLADRGPGSVRDDLVEFYRQHYSANLMALVVLGKEPIATLRQWVSEAFSSVPNSDARPLEITAPPFVPEALPARLDVVPVKTARELSLLFPVPPVTEHYRTGPLRYIAELVGHEGAGSLLSLLKERGWASALSAGLGSDLTDHATFRVTILLTESGLERVTDVAARVFQYLGLIRERGINERIFDEQRRLGEIAFRFRDNVAPLAYVRSLANDMHEYPIGDVLRARYAMDVYEPSLIAGFLDRLRADNVMMTVVAPELAVDATSPWFDTSYRLSRVDRETIERWRTGPQDPRLSLPPPNDFIPADLALKPVGVAPAVPTLTRRSKRVELWFQQDSTYQTPRSDFYFSVRSPAANSSARNAAMTELYVDLVNDQLSEFSYPANVAGLKYTLYRHARGFSVRISGYSDKQDRLLSRIVEVLRSPRMQADRFAMLKERLIHTLGNRKQDPPYQQALAEVVKLLMEPYWPDEELIAALRPLNVGELEAFARELLASVYVVSLAHGNLHHSDANRLAGILEQTLIADSQIQDVADNRVVRLDPGARYVRELQIEHPDSAVAIYLQGPDRSDASRAAFQLLSQVLSTPFYAELRTRQQLGYVVHASTLSVLEAPGIVFVVQSPNTDVDQLQANIEDFLSTYRDQLKAMTPEQFDHHRAGLITRILEAEENLHERSHRYWNEIDRKHCEFDSRQRLVDAVNGISQDELVTVYERYLMNPARKQLVVSSSGHQRRVEVARRPSDEGVISISDPTAFSRGKDYFPPRWAQAQPTQSSEGVTAARPLPEPHHGS